MGNRRPFARHAFVVLGAVIILAGSAFSQKPSAWKGRIENEGGIVVVKNPRKPAYGPGAFSLIEELALGGETAEGYVFASIGSIAVGGDGTIFALDNKDKAVKAFDREGKFLRTIGKAGQGPGEFMLPMSIHWMEPDELAVVDPRRRILVFKADGRHVRDINVSNMSFADARPDSKGNYYTYSIVYDEENGRYDLRKVDAAFKDLFAIESSPTPNSQRDGFDPFFPLVRWAILPGDGVVCGYAVKGELRVRDEAGKLVRRIEMDREPVPVAKEDVDERTEGMPPSLLTNLKVPKHYPAFRYLTADDAGRIYVLCWERPPGRKGYYVDIFDPEGRYLARAAVPALQPLIDKDRLYAAEEDVDGNPVLKRYRIVRDF